MSNMSYCRFENTASDLDDCLNALEDMGWDLSEMPDSERLAAHQLIKCCRYIADSFDGSEQ